MNKDTAVYYLTWFSPTYVFKFK